MCGSRVGVWTYGMKAVAAGVWDWVIRVRSNERAQKDDSELYLGMHMGRTIYGVRYS